MSRARGPLLRGPMMDRLRTMIAAVTTRVSALMTWWGSTRVGRALARYSQANGGLLCGGIAYSAMFSLFAGLTIGYSAFMAVLGNNNELRESVLAALDRALPGLIDTGDGDGIVSPAAFVLSAGLSWTSVIAVAVLLFSAISCMGAIRRSVRIMFDTPVPTGLTATLRVREFVGFVGVGLAVLISATAGIVVASANHWILDLLGISGGSRVLLPLMAGLASAAIDVGVFFLIVVVLAGLRPPRIKVLQGALLMAIALGIVRFLGTSVVARTPAANPILASFAVMVTLLVWINLFARILLMCAAVSADPPALARPRATDAPGEADAPRTAGAASVSKAPSSDAPDAPGSSDATRTV